MRNNKQDLLMSIRIEMSILKYDDEKMQELFGKTYQQISKLTYDDIKPIRKKLRNIYEQENNN